MQVQLKSYRVALRWYVYKIFLETITGIERTYFTLKCNYFTVGIIKMAKVNQF